MKESLKATLSKEYFQKALKSYKLSLKIITEPSLAEFQDASIRELFNAFELILKSFIAQEHPFILATKKTKNDLRQAKNGNAFKKFDDLHTRNVEELIEILQFLKNDDKNFSFLEDPHKRIEKIRTERNALEHSHRQITAGYINDIIAPFILEIIRPSFIQYDKIECEELFSPKNLSPILDKVDDFTNLVPDKNKFNLIKKYSCRECLHNYAFISKSNKHLYCVICENEVISNEEIELVKCIDCNSESVTVESDNCFICPKCDDTLLHQDCPDCQATKAVISGDQLFCTKCKYKEKLLNCPICSEDKLCSSNNYCFYCDETLSGDPKISVHGLCHCRPQNIINLEPENGEEEGYCLGCHQKFELWECSECNNFFTDDKGEPPEEYPCRCCEDCAFGLREAYRLPDD